MPRGLMVALYMLTSMISAFTLFLIQPMIAKAALPTLGGAPLVWNGCMLFFQTFLLLGYLYADALRRFLTPIQQRGIHLLLLGCVVFGMPLQLAQPAVDASLFPITWLLLMLAGSVGLMFFCLSATAPLTQYWFARTDHPQAHNPYFLYAAGNFASFAALLVYPLCVEPLMTRAQQLNLLTICFLLLALVMTVVISITPLKNHNPEMVETKSPVAAARLAQWVLIACIPASLLYGVTAYITTDIASVPLLWIVPLALYLLSYIVAFSERFAWLQRWSRTRHGLVGLALLATTLMIPSAPLWFLAFHWLAFFCICISCHSLLASLKPPAHQLTQFYIMLSLGGALAGILNTLVAPKIFSDIVEYPLVLLLSLACIPRMGAYDSTRRRALALAVMAVIGAAWLMWYRPSGVHTVEVARNDFGTSRVIWHEKLQAYALRHGRTSHGIQSVDPQKRLQVTSYYAPLGSLFDLVHEQGSARVAGIGMGLGTLACHAKKNEKVDFFEIDPDVVRFAKDTRYFSYLHDCPPEISITLGDGRLSLAKMPDASYHLIVVDAFSSDAIPTHLLTQEAVEMYLRKLKPEGFLALHISNNHVRLAPVISAIASQLGVGALHLVDLRDPDELVFSSEWVVLMPSAAQQHKLLQSKVYAWKPLAEADARDRWTDDYSNVFRHLK